MQRTWSLGVKGVNKVCSRRERRNKHGYLQNEDSPTSVCQKGPSLLKKSPPDRSVVPKQGQTPPKQARTTYKTRFSTSEQGSESDAREFFNKLDRF